MTRWQRVMAGVPLAAGLAFGATLAAQQNTGAVALRAAIERETVRGDLPGAIESYKELSQHSDPAVVAEALVRLAAGYDKLGQTNDARAAYERVVREFPGETRAVAEATRWLAANALDPAGQVVRREELVWSGRDVNLAGRPSIDGGYLAFVLWEAGGELAVRDLRTGERRVLTDEVAPDGFVENPVPSIDGRQIAYRFGEQDSAIRMVDADGTNPRVLLHDDHNHYLQAWSPDGRFLVAERTNPDDTFAIVLISADDGATIQVRSTGPRYPSVGGFSPDGRYLVYAVGQEGPTGTGGVYLLPIGLPTEGAPELGPEIPLVEGPANFRSPLWTPDGRRVLFSSTRSGSPELWAVVVTDGRPEGPPDLVQVGRAGGGTSTLGFTRGGSFYYGVTDVRGEAYTADFDPETLTVGTPAIISDRGVGSNESPAWSPDGQSVAFLRRLPGQGARGGAPVIVRNTRTGDERVVATLDRGAYGARALEWFPNGRSILVTDGTNVEGENRKRFRQIDVESGEERVLFDAPWNVWMGSLAANGRELFYSIKEEGIIRLVSREIDTGSETELYRERNGSTIGFLGLSASPDSTHVAFVVNNDDGTRSLAVVAADDGMYREVHRFSGGSGTWASANNGGLTWTADSRHIVFTGRCGPTAEEESDQLCAIPAEGGDVRFLGLGMPGITSREISPDGRRVAFTGTTIKREVWVVRNPFPDGE